MKELNEAVIEAMGNFSEKSTTQVKSLHEFYSPKDIIYALTDMLAFCALEKLYLEGVKDDHMEESDYSNLITFRLTERIDRFYRGTIDLCNSTDVIELQYKRTGLADGLNQLAELYE